MQYTAVKNSIQYQIISYHYTMMYTYKHIKHIYIYVCICQNKDTGGPCRFYWSSTTMYPIHREAQYIVVPQKDAENLDTD